MIFFGLPVCHFHYVALHLLGLVFGPLHRWHGGPLSRRRCRHLRSVNQNHLINVHWRRDETPLPCCFPPQHTIPLCLGLYSIPPPWLSDVSSEPILWWTREEEDRKSTDWILVKYVGKAVKGMRNECERISGRATMTWTEIEMDGWMTSKIRRRRTGEILFDG